MKTKRKPRRPKQESRITWREIEPTPHGNKRWQSLDGMFQLICQDRLDDIPLDPLWVLWQFKRGNWWRVYDHRGRRKVYAEAERRAEQLEKEDDDD
jgi:hypothetical protein